MKSEDLHLIPESVKTASKRLIVYWGPDDEVDYQTPKELQWEDGTPATMEDYRKLQAATRTSRLTEKGLATVFFPDVSSITTFDKAKGHWIVNASNGDVLDLLEEDPNASDKHLLSEIGNNTVIYKTTIDRSHLS